MQKHEIDLSNVRPEDAGRYSENILDLLNIFYAGASSTSHLGRTTDEDALMQIDRFIAHAEKKAAQIRRAIEDKKVHDKAFSAGHAEGFQLGKEQGYEDGVKDARQEFPHLEPHLAQIAKNGTGLMIVHIDGGAQRDFQSPRA